jgi:hypothetical protein
LTNDTNPAVAIVRNAPNAQLYAIDVSFAQLNDKAERAYLNQLPTSFVLTDEEVDRLRAAAGRIILDSPDFEPAEGRRREDRRPARRQAEGLTVSCDAPPRGPDR